MDALNLYQEVRINLGPPYRLLRSDVLGKDPEGRVIWIKLFFGNSNPYWTGNHFDIPECESKTSMIVVFTSPLNEVTSIVGYVSLFSFANLSTCNLFLHVDKDKYPLHHIDIYWIFLVIFYVYHFLKSFRRPIFQLCIFVKRVGVCFRSTFYITFFERMYVIVVSLFYWSLFDLFFTRLECTCFEISFFLFLINFLVFLGRTRTDLVDLVSCLQPNIVPLYI